MGIGIELGVIFAYALGLILLYIIGYILLFPIKLIIKLVYNGIIGGIILLIASFLGNLIGFTVIINPLTALITGFLGIPGAVMIILLQNIL